MTDALRKNPAFADKLQHVQNGQSMPVSVLAKYATEQNVLGSASQGIKTQADEYNTTNAKSPIKYDLNAAMTKDPTIRTILPELGKYSMYPLDIALDKMSADPALKNKGTAMQAYMNSLGDAGLTREGLQAMSNARVQAAKAAGKGQGAQPVDSKIVDSAKNDIAVRNPNLPQGIVDSYTRQLGPKPTYDEYNKIMEEAGKTSDRITNQTLARNKLSDQEQTQLFNNGKVGDTKLTLDNASDEMLVDQHTGQPIPWRALNKMAPTQQESNRADFADTVLRTADTLQKMKQAGVLPNGPLSGVTAQMLGKYGMSSEDAGKALAAIGFMQTAATGAHVGGRFSIPVMEKMNKLVGLNMNDSQFMGSINEITDVMQHYKDKGGRISVKEWSEMDSTERKRMMTSTSLAGANAGGEGNAGTITADLTSITSANKVPAYKDGKIVGYADDKTGTNFHQF
jgi:hypothetical protein